MRRLLRRIAIPLLYVGSRRFRNHEVACIQALRGALSEAGRRLLDEQLAEVELVQRGPKDKRVMIQFDPRIIHSDPRTPIRRFENRGQEQHVAQVTLKATGAGKRSRMRCVVVFYDGLFRGLDFSQSPKDLKDGFEVVGIDLLIDPMVPLAAAPVRYREVVPPALAALGATDVQPPASAEEQQRFMKRAAEVMFPEDYLALLRQTNGFRIGECEFLGTEARHAVRADANLWLLAISPVDVALCVVEGRGAPELYLWNEVDEHLETAGTSFMGALRKLLETVAELGEE